MDTNIDKKLDKHLNLIERHAHVALKKIMKPVKYSLDDLIQEGVLAFLYAKRGFEEDRNTSFRTYLTTCLRNHFTNLVKQTYHNKERSDYSSLEEINSISKIIDNAIFNSSAFFIT